MPPMFVMPYMLPRAPVGMEGIEATYGIPISYGVPGVPWLPAAGGLPGMLPCSLIGAPMEPYALPTMLRGAMPPGMMMRMPHAAHAAMMRSMMPLTAQPGLSGLGSLPGTVPPAPAWSPLSPPDAAQAPLMATTTSGLTGPQLQASMGLGETSTAHQSAPATTTLSTLTSILTSPSP